MLLVRCLLKWMMRVIQFLLAVILFYFPTVELLTRFSPKAHIYQAHPNLSVEDSLLPCLALALIYGLISFVREKIQQADVSEGHSEDLDGN